jgi:hypothetical protein
MKNLCAQLYKNDEGEPFQLTDGQAEIFWLIVKRKNPRNHCMTYTRYGKSVVVALAILTRVTQYAEMWAVLAGRKGQAGIIMGYIIEHIFDNETARSKFVIDRGETIDFIRRHRSKDRINFKHANGRLGEVFVISADAKNKKEAGNSVMGFGAPNVVLDEAALIDDDIEVKIFRMLGDKPDNFYFKIGNPFRRNHFLIDFEDENYYHFSADYIRGLEEGRLSYRFVEEVRKKPLFDVLYGNQFPAADAIDEDNFVPLFTEDQIHEIEAVDFTAETRLGLDPSGMGENLSSWAVRDAFSLMIAATEEKSTEKSIAEKTIGLVSLFCTREREVCVDDLGKGAKAIAELGREGLNCTPVTLGDPPMKDKVYINIRTELAFKFQEWVLKGGKIVKNPKLRKQMLAMSYKVITGKRIRLMTKEEMRDRGLPSPDEFDSAIISFFPDLAEIESEEDQAEADEEHEEMLDKYEPECA